MFKRLGILGGLVLVTLLLAMFAGTALAAPPSPTPGPGNGFGLLDRVTLQRVATLLGTTPDDVNTQLQQGKTLLQIAQAKNVTEQALTDTILQPMKDRMALEVKYGYLTQDQADAQLQYQQTRVNDLINATPGANGNYGYGYGGCLGGGLGPGGMMGFGGYGGMMGFGGRGMMGYW